MPERREAILREPQQAKQALDWLYAQAKPWLMAGHELAVTLSPKKQDSRHVGMADPAAASERGRVEG